MKFYVVNQNWHKKKIQGKMVKIKVKDGGILEGEIIENDC